MGGSSSSGDSIFPNNITDMTAQGPLAERPLSVKASMILEQVAMELRGAIEDYPPMTSFHEGYAIIQEELDELWDEIKVKPKYRNIDLMRMEAIQVAAMAARFILDTIPDEEV